MVVSHFASMYCRVAYCFIWWLVSDIGTSHFNLVAVHLDCDTHSLFWQCEEKHGVKVNIA
jgi:hypothetical protein